jgi:glutathione-regulated potassium-efflux system protein KefB
LFDQSKPAAIVLGLGLALSSTAFGLQVLAERGATWASLMAAWPWPSCCSGHCRHSLIAVVPLLGDVSTADEGAWPLLAVAVGIGVLIVLAVIC